ncbi:MAG: RAVE protein 1 C terminal-domain-containing protein [Benjaminiella poitrasii]|nr:MAG: RAVE protein 1 C terminal-domain-containing protein [Benjaminiella poitrasii]
MGKSMSGNMNCERLQKFISCTSRQRKIPGCIRRSPKNLSSLHVYNIDDASSSFLLFGVSATQKKITTWHLIPHEDRLDIIYRGTKVMPWTVVPDLIESSSQWATNTVTKLLHRLASHNQYALAVSLRTNVTFYTVNTDNPIVEWQMLFTLDTSSVASSIYQVRCASHMMAIVSDQDRKTLSIWTEIRTDIAPICVKVFNFDESIRDIAWNVTSDAQFILAVAFSKSISIIGQKRVRNTNSDDDSWTCYTKFNTDLQEDITALAWVDCGVLTVAAGNQLRCYLKWLTSKDQVAEFVQGSKNNKTESMSSIFDVSYEMNGPLPFYHPDHLIHYIMWGNMDVVHAVLVILSNFFKQFVDDEDDTIDDIPHISFSKMLKLQNNHSNKSDAKQQYQTLFEETSDHDFGITVPTPSDDDDDNFVRSLTANEAKNLTYALKRKRLPGLDENEKIRLIAMVDTIVEITNQGESLDENGARFTALLENHFHLYRSLPEDQRQLDLQPRDFAWALHSQSQDLLLERCIKLCGDKLVWEDARSLGIFLWLQKIDVVREQMSNIARNIYLSKTDYRDPVDCSLFYLALRKKKLLQGLWNTATYHREQAAMKKFLANDFDDPRWQRAAAKNAFALLGKQRFEYAAAFFLLADKLKDAVNVILKNVKDYQLAIAICRVYEGDHSPLLKEILENTVIPMAIETNDRWLVSMAFWLLNKQKDAVRAMVVPLSQFADTTEADSAAIVREPNAFILYHYLKKCLRQDQNMIVPYNIEYAFSLRVSQSYERLGCPLLALYILTKFYMKPPKDTPTTEKSVKLDRAEDLFASSPTPSNAKDIFADEIEYKPARAADLFADDSFSDSKPSNASDLFADEDIFANAKKPSNNLFDEEEDTLLISNQESKDLFNDNSLPDMDGNDEESIINFSDKEYDSLDGYRALLVIRLLQTFFHAASLFYNGFEESMNVHEIKYRSLFLKNRQALLDLGESVKIPPNVLSRLLMEKSIETDVFPLYLYILNETIPKDFDVHQFLRYFKVGCFEVNEVALMPQDLDYATLVFVENWTKHVIRTFPIWNSLRNRYCSPETASFTTRQIALATYISIILITLKERHYESSWPLLCHFKYFLEAIGSNGGDVALSNCFAQLYKNDTKMVEMSVDDFESFSDGSMLGYDMNEEVYRPLIDCQDKSVGANLLELASLNYALSAIEHAMQCQGRHNSLSEKLSDFIWTTLLDPVAYRAHCLKEIISSQLEGNLSRRNVLKQLKTLRQKKYWHSIKSLSVFDRLLPFENNMSINILTEDHQPDHFLNVYHSTSTIYGFCLNSSAQDSMAVCLKSEIQEIDLSKASNSFSMLGQDRYPLLVYRNII